MTTAASIRTGHSPLEGRWGLFHRTPCPSAPPPQPWERSSLCAHQGARRTTPLTSARVVAMTMHAAYRMSPSRFPATTTQFADSSMLTPYAAQNAAVSASSASIGALEPRDDGSRPPAPWLPPGPADPDGQGHARRAEFPARAHGATGLPTDFQQPSVPASRAFQPARGVSARAFQPAERSIPAARPRYLGLSGTEGGRQR